VLKEAYNMGVLRLGYLSIDIRCFLFHVEFEDGLSISVLKNRPTQYKNSQLEIVKFLKSQVCPPPFISPPDFFILSVGQDLAHQYMTELARWLEHVQKSKSHGDGFSNRILLTE
jgi:hypothetical protein